LSDQSEGKNSPISFPNQSPPLKKEAVNAPLFKKKIIGSFFQKSYLFKVHFPIHSAFYIYQFK